MAVAHAIAVGVADAFWPTPVQNFLWLYFLSMVLGGFTSVLVAVLLRWVATSFRWRRGWHWAVTGAFLALAVVSALRFVGSLIPDTIPGWLKLFVGLVVIAPEVIHSPGNLWSTLPAGAATGFVLFKVNRAFGEQP
jgi:MFS family permease